MYCNCKFLTECLAAFIVLLFACALFVLDLAQKNKHCIAFAEYLHNRMTNIISRDFSKNIFENFYEKISDSCLESWCIDYKWFFNADRDNSKQGSRFSRDLRRPRDYKGTLNSLNRLHELKWGLSKQKFKNS